MDAVREFIAGGDFFSGAERDLEETGALAEPDATLTRCDVLVVAQKREGVCPP